MRDCLCARLSAIGLPNDIKLPIVDIVNKWVACNGPEWTVDRLKAMKVDLIHSWGGLPPSSTGIAYRCGLPKGPFRPLWRMVSRKGKIKALSALMIYTYFLSPYVTEKQLNKFVKSVISSGKEEIDPLTEEFSRSIFKNKFVEHALGRHIKHSWKPDFESYPWSSSRFMPTFEGKTVPEISESFSPIDSVLMLSVKSRGFCRLLVKYGILQQALPEDFRDRIVGRAEVTDVYEEAKGKPDFYSLDNVGRISFIQEPGYKLRAVANPHRIYQVALMPLQRQLDEILKEMRWSAVHDQEKGVLDVQTALAEGHRMHTIDLQDATNNFPLQFQVELMSGLRAVDKEALGLFVDVSRAPWLIPVGPGQFETVQWKTGQPLGLGPSFASFTLCHGWLLSKLDNKVKTEEEAQGIKVEDGPRFRIIGDDVVIWNDRLADLYQLWLSNSRIPISPSKSMVSDHVAEFGGKVILKDLILPQLKWRDPSDNSFVDIARNLGPQSLSLFTPRQRRILKMIAPVPVEAGGLGWNPKGIPYETRMDSDVAKAIMPGEKASLLERGLSRSNTMRYASAYIHEFDPTGVLTPAQPQVEIGKLPVRDRILLSANVLSEEFLDSEKSKIPGWRSPISISDPRGPSLANVLERKLDGVPRAR